ncbi:MAG: hypothetical protein AAF642_04170 [Pseudomonadota bacterium]
MTQHLELIDEFLNAHGFTRSKKKYFIRNTSAEISIGYQVFVDKRPMGHVLVQFGFCCFCKRIMLKLKQLEPRQYAMLASSDPIFLISIDDVAEQLKIKKSRALNWYSSLELPIETWLKEFEPVFQQINEYFELHTGSDAALGALLSSGDLFIRESEDIKRVI